MNKVKIGDVTYMLKGKRMVVDPSVPPKEWPNGSAIYREGKGDRGPRWRTGYNPHIGLVGHTLKRNGKVAAWRHTGSGRYEYAGEFENHLTAMKSIAR